MAGHLPILNYKRFQGEEDYNDFKNVVESIKTDFKSGMGELLNNPKFTVPDDEVAKEYRMEEGSKREREWVCFYRHGEELENCYDSFEVHYTYKNNTDQLELMEVYYVA